MSKNKRDIAKTAFGFVLIIGIVNLFADMTYEGARSITGPFLGSLGASATVVGLVAGTGELRLLCQSRIPLADKYIVAAIDAQLATKGWQKVESDSDVVVIYAAGRTTETQINPFAPGGPYSGYRWAWKAAAAFDASGLQPISVGELIVDMADVKNKTFMWTANAKDTLSHDFEKKKKTVDKALAKVFKNFPPTPKQK